MVFARTTGATYVSGTVTCLCRARLISSHPTVIDAMPTRKLRFAVDSPVEGDGFERSVPGLRDPQTVTGDGTALEKGADLSGNGRFESISLQQGVRCEPDFRGSAQGPRPLTRHVIERLGCLVG